MDWVRKYVFRILRGEQIVPQEQDISPKLMKGIDSFQVLAKEQISIIRMNKNRSR